MNGKGSLVETLSNSSLYADYARAYSEATGLPIALRPVETWQLALHGRHKENRFCTLMAGRSRTCAACIRLQQKLTQGAMEQPLTATCDYGLSETAVPVRLGKDTFGFLQTGQVFRQKPTEAQFVRVAEYVAKMNLGLDENELKQAYFETPVVSQARMDSVTNLLSIFAGHLSLIGNQIAVLQSNVEPPVITRAKHFILDHLTEGLSLGQVAHAVQTSIFHFCKLFRKVTGITFTEFVSRARTERAKNLLLDPNLRVSEIAYEAGFQSLPHFNRTFKAVVGESPTDYRSHLPKAA
jgi:AraC-like DNA-binding protein